MAIYLPPLFCGVAAKLKLIKDLNWNEVHIPHYEICEVVDIIGWTYVIKPMGNQSHINHRMKNSIMLEYFEILEEGYKEWIDESRKLLQENTYLRARQIKDIKILVSKSESFNVVGGSEYYCIRDNSDNGRVHWDLFEVKTIEKTLRLKDEEFMEHMEIM